ncbi:MAG: chorismate mutase [Alphaproteobacteria bacterium]|jgi:chorismate mutase|nr:chorismate mutase [Alphaproteobacteria bacterium]
MSTPLPSLDSLRREIDEIDDAIHDLLMRRCRIVEQISRVKGGGTNPMRPAREAVIVRRLVDRHEGAFPLPVLVRMWREMLAGTKQVQGPLAIAVATPDGNRDLWDLARDHYGATVPTTAFPGPIQAVRAVMDGRATAAVLPLPQDDAADEPWWIALMSPDPRTPRIVERLPFLPGARTDGQSGWTGALAVALARPEPTGDDHAFVAVDLAEDASRGRIKDLMEASGLPTVAFWGHDRSRHGEAGLLLVEVADFVGEDDPRLATLAEKLGATGRRVQPIGCYPRPLDAATLAAVAAPTHA